MKNIVAFVCVGIAFLVLFLPYIVWRTLEARLNGLLSETVIVSRLGNLALHELFRDDTGAGSSGLQGSTH
jgi:hypothetical protein